MEEYIVVVKAGEDLTTLDSELAASSGDGAIPTRAVECCDTCPHDSRMTHWMLTAEEAQTLKDDPRILDVEKPLKNRTDEIVVESVARQPETFTKTATSVGGCNWGLSRSSNIVDNFDGNTSIFGNYKYVMTGDGVDVVIMDSGIELDHPEFKDATGAGRIQAIDWFANHSGVANPHAGSGPMGPEWYQDTDGHGTFCASISCGKKYGWAKNAHIYSIPIYDNPSAVSTELAMDLVRQWHNNKGNNRPTIVNMSFGFFYSFDEPIAPQAGDSGQVWDTFTGQMDVWNFGDAGYANTTEIEDNTDLNGFTKPAFRSAVVDAKIDQMIADGIHVSIAANNNYEVQYEYSDDVNDNYSDFMVRPSFAGGAQVFYHRGSSPRGTQIGGAEMVVGNIGVDYTNNKERLNPSSANGEALDIFAPGTNIVAGASNINSGNYADSPHPEDGAFKIGVSSGTSFSCPQVVGVGALYLQNEPNITPAQLKAKMLHDAKTGLLYDDLNWDQKDLGKYADHVTNNKGLMGGPNKVLYNRFVGDVFVRYVAAGGGD